jgi:hypothetical protein
MLRRCSGGLLEGFHSFCACQRRQVISFISRLPRIESPRCQFGFSCLHERSAIPQ